MSTGPRWVLVFNRLDLESFRYAEWIKSRAAERGLELRVALLSDSAPLEAVRKKNSELLKHYDRVEGFPSYGLSGVVEKRALEWVSELNVQGVVALSEMDLLRAARVRSSGRVAGVQSESYVLKFRDKLEMKNHAQSRGVPCPAFREISSLLQLQSVVNEWGFPFVMKPRREGGAHGVEVIRSNADLEAYLAKGWLKSIDGSIDLMAEKLIDGRMYHADGLVVKGEIQRFAVSRYLKSCLENRQGHAGGGTLSHPDSDPARTLKALVSALLKECGPESSFAFHGEFFQESSTGQYLLCELALRHGGAGIREYLDDCGLGDIAKDSVLAQAGVSPDLSSVKSALPGLKDPHAYFIVPTRPGRFDLNEAWTTHAGLSSVVIVREILHKERGSSCSASTHSADLAATLVVKMPDWMTSDAESDRLLTVVPERYSFLKEAGA